MQGGCFYEIALRNTRDTGPGLGKERNGGAMLGYFGARRMSGRQDRFTSPNEDLTYSRQSSNSNQEEFDDQPIPLKCQHAVPTNPH